MAAVAALPPHLSRWGLLGTCQGSEWSVVALESVSSEVVIRGFVAQVSANLVYLNSAAHPLQVQAVFPVDESAAVYHCEARLDGRTIVTHCMEKKKAEKVYKEAVAAGQTAVMAREHEDTSDILKLNLGNLPAGSRAEVNLRLVMELKVQTDGGIAFVLPTVLNPRYCPPDHPLRQEAQVHSLFGRYFEGYIVHVPQPYSIDVKAEVSGSHGIARIISHTDPLNVTLADDALTAQVRQDGEFKCDHDWSVLVYYNNPYAPHLLRETGDRSATGIMKDDLLMFNFFPDVPVDTFSSKNEIIFVIDRSGSMMGAKIHSAKATLLLFLKSLPVGCLFNVVSFGNTFSLLFPEGSREYTEKTLAIACNLQATMEADMGGTEILRPLQDVYSKPPKPGFSRQILLITDGEVWNVDQVLQLVGRHAHEARLFSVGIGHGASTALVRGVARAGRGRSEMVAQQKLQQQQQQQQLLQHKVMGLVSSMVQESVQDVSITCEVEPVSRVTLVPKVPSVIFGGQHLILYARVPATTQVKSVTVRGQLGAKVMLDTLDAQHITTVHDEAKSLHRLAARAQLLQWQLDEEEDVAEDMVALSVASGVMCRRTALVGVDQESKKPVSQFQPREMCEEGFCGGFASGGVFSKLQSFGSTADSLAPQSGMFGSAAPVPPAPPGISPQVGGFSFGATTTSEHSGFASGGVFSKLQSIDNTADSLAQNAVMFGSAAPVPPAPPGISPQVGGFSFGAATTSEHSGSVFGGGFVQIQSFGSTADSLAPQSGMFGSAAPVPPAPPGISPQVGGFSFGAATTSEHSGGIFSKMKACSAAPRSAMFGGAAPVPPAPPGISPQVGGFSFGAATTSELRTQQCGEYDNKDDHVVDEPPPSGSLGVVSLQRFDGSWTLQDAAQLTNMPLDSLSASNPVKREAAWATALVLVLLEKKFGEEKDLWALMVTKARTFITGCGEQVEDLLAKARLVLDSK